MKLSDIIPRLRNPDADPQPLEIADLALEDERIVGWQLEGSTFERVSFAPLEFVNCDFTASHFFDCHLAATRFINCTFHKAEFHACKFEQVIISRSSFTRSEWYGGRLQGAVSHCDFSWSYVDSVDARRAHFQYLRLEGAIWSGVKVYEAVFESTDLGGDRTARFVDMDVSLEADGTKLITMERFREIFGA